MFNYLSQLINSFAPHRLIRASEERLKTQIVETEEKATQHLVELREQLLNVREQTALSIQRRRTAEKRTARQAERYDTREYLKTLEHLFPNTFPTWKAAFDEGANEYASRLPSSLSVEGNAGADAFRKFLSLHLHGHVLDIGCGPQPLPSYFKGFQIDRLAGIDPLPRDCEHLYEFVQGFAERLPWPAGEFDTVTIATSLDHVLSLDLALQEVRRVMRPDGVLILWVSFVAGAPPYDPLNPAIVPIDRFHLFHFDRDWFLAIMHKYFALVEEFAYDRQSYFYAFTKHVDPSTPNDPPGASRNSC